MEQACNVKIKCSKCDRFINKPNFDKHFNVCNGENKNRLIIKDEWKNVDNLYKCPHCDKKYSLMGIGTHIWRKHGKGTTHNTNSNVGYKKGQKIWNLGLTKDSHPGMKKASETIKKRLKNGTIKHAFLGRHHTKESKEKIGKFGGIRKGAGRGKHGWYNGYWCDSSWELAWVIYNLEHGIKFERNHKWFYYTYEGKQYKFYPDFIKDGIYVEIKGYVNNKSKEKIAQFKEEIELITDVSMYTNYVINKYGKDFIRLYE